MQKSLPAQVRDVLWSGKPANEKLDGILALAAVIANDPAATPEVKALGTIVDHLKSQLPVPAPAVVETDIAA